MSQRVKKGMASNRPSFKLALLPWAVAAAISAPSFAEEAEETVEQEGEVVKTEEKPIEEVTVYGIRSAIKAASDMKFDAGGVVEAISAEDIGKLPDTSIADSISRLPGITSQRADGRASAVSVRGTDPGFTTALLNGREIVSTGQNRSVEFDQFPSELLSGVLVYKTPDAKLAAQGLAGTIDLQTIRPLNLNERVFVLNGRYEMNSNDDLGADSEDDGNRVSFSYVDQLMDGKLGVAVGYARLDSTIATKTFGAYEPWQNIENKANDLIAFGGDKTFQSDYLDGLNQGIPDGTQAVYGFKSRADMGRNERDGFMGVIQFEPNERFSSIVDVYYSTFDQELNARSLEVNIGAYPSFWGENGGWVAGDLFDYSNATIENNSVVAGTLNNIVPLARNFLFTTEDTVSAFGWNNKFALTDEWTLVADLSYSHAERIQRQYETQAQYVPTGGMPSNQYDNGSVDLNGGEDMPTLEFGLDYADPAQVQVGNTIYGSGYSKLPKFEDELQSVRFDAIRSMDDLPFVSEVAFGLNYTERTKTADTAEGGLNTINGEYYQIADEFLLPNTNLGYSNSGEALAWDVKGVLGEYFETPVYGTPETGSLFLAGKVWEISEKITTAYARAKLDHEISESIKLRGNVGLQVVQTDQSSDAFAEANGTVVGVTDGKTYTNVLPQMNLAFHLQDEQIVRVGLAKALTRARMDQLGAYVQGGYNQATGEPGGSAGNSQLDPWIANTFDVSYEKYFADGLGYVAIAGFYKDLESYIYTQQSERNFSYLLDSLPSDYFADGVVPQDTGLVTTPENGDGGTVKGVELSSSVPFEVFSEMLEGAGAQFSYSYTESDITYEGQIGGIASGVPLPGLSSDVWNATLYYEKHGFGARMATRYRSEYIGELTAFDNSRRNRFVDADLITDLQLSYSFEEYSELEGLQVLFQVNNLTDEPYFSYSDNKSRVIDYQTYGTQYLLGVNYKF